MILRPLEPPPASSELLPAWNVVEQVQRQPYEACWMITQPSHAVLAGDFAARMNCPQAPRLDATLLRAIALHDAGWGVPDAQAIMRSRSVRRGCPRSFIECTVPEFLEAWEKSIEVAASTGPAGGYMVSRHFVRIAEQSAAQLSEPDRTHAAAFLKNESTRQRRLAAKQDCSRDDLERLTDVLQFCDLLSLYVCSGARDSAVFPEYFGVKVRVTVPEEGYRLDPPLIEPGAVFSTAVLRHPATKDVSSHELQIRML
jgi:uncharacterized protein DUF3891